MKKKSIALIATMALALSMTACGGKTEEAANTNVNEPVVESTVQESQPEATEAPVQESQEVAESSEAPVETEAPVEEETKPYTISELVYPDGSNSNVIDANEEDFMLVYEKYMMNEINAPYYTVTNTSDQAYRITIGNGHEDKNFEPGECMVVAAFPCSGGHYLQAGDGSVYDNEFDYFWMNADDAFALFQDGDPIQIGDVNLTGNNLNRVHEMKTINNGDAFEITGPNVAEFPNPAVEYVIFYDEAGNILHCSALNFEIRETEFLTGYINEWASADVYYSYEVAQ